MEVTINMEREEVLEKAGKKKAVLGEMEKAKINKSCWIANIVAVVAATAFMITLGAMGVFIGLYSVATICFLWSSVFYFCQYFIAKRPYGVLIGAILSCVGAVIMFAFFLLFSFGVL